MVATESPDGWGERIAREREEKDRYFKEDPERPLLAEDVESFQGLDYWPLDPSRRFVGPIHLYPRPERFTILTTSGKQRPCEKYGWLSFVLDGQVCVLQVYRLLDMEPSDDVSSLFLPFTDETTGRETYPAGRYLELESTENGRYVLDFNRAANPYCAYGAPERFACPVTPPANRLPVRIEAGERGYKHREEAGR